MYMTMPITKPKRGARTQYTPAMRRAAQVHLAWHAFDARRPGLRNLVFFVLRVSQPEAPLRGSR